MEITSVKVSKYESEGSNVKGFASVVLDGCFAVHNIRIIEGDKGLFIAMPSRKVKTEDGYGFRDLAHPIDKPTRKLFDDTILEAFKNSDK